MTSKTFLTSFNRGRGPPGSATEDLNRRLTLFPVQSLTYHLVSSVSKTYQTCA